MNINNNRREEVENMWNMRTEVVPMGSVPQTGEVSPAKDQRMMG